MLFAGTFLCSTAFFLLYIRFSYLFFGKSAKGQIIGFYEAVPGLRGTRVYSYKVRYEYNGKIYIAKSFENVATFSPAAPIKNINKQVTVYFKEGKPEVVIIKEFKQIFILSLILLAFVTAAIITEI